MKYSLSILSNNEYVELVYFSEDIGGYQHHFQHGFPPYQITLIWRVYLNIAMINSCIPMKINREIKCALCLLQIQIMYLYKLIYYSKTCLSDLEKNLPCMTLVFSAPCIDFFVSTCI